MRGRLSFVVAFTTAGLAAANPEYTLSSSAVCPTGSYRIRKKTDCETAAVQLLLSSTTAQDYTGSATYPKGCFLAQVSGSSSRQLYWYVSGSEDTTITEAKSLCAWGEEDEQLGYLGDCGADDTNPDHANIAVRVASLLPSTATMPASFDARTKWPYCYKEVVRSQGSCGSCWAFAPTSVVRQRACIYDCNENGRCDSTNAMNGRHISVQHIMGCGKSKRGCQGGWANDAYSSMKEVGVIWEYDVPYRCGGGNIEDQFGGASLTCTAWPWATPTSACSLDQKHVDVTSIYRLPQDAPSVSDLMAAEIAANGPIAVDFCVRNNFFNYWKNNPTRIYVEADGCGSDEGIVGGHMVSLIGYGTKEQGGQQVKYWIAQNSWSDDWGHSGFFYMERGVNLCGIENKASGVDVTVSKDIPPVPNPNHTSTTGSTVAPEDMTTTAPVDPPLPQERSEDDDGFEVPEWFFWLLLILFLLCALGCLITFCILMYVMYCQPEKRNEVRDAERLGGDTPGNSGEVAKVPFTTQNQQPDAEVWGKTEETTQEPPDEVVGAVAAGKPKTAQSKAKKKKEPYPVAPTASGDDEDGSGKDEKTENVPIPPWWRKEPEVYNDNVEKRETGKESSKDPPPATGEGPDAV